MKKTITYIGRRGNPTLKHYYTYGVDTFSYKRVLVAAAKISALIEITENENGSVKLNPDDAPRIVGYSDDKETVARWEVQSHADVVAYNQRRNEKVINREHSTPVERSVKTLRIAMIGMNRPARAAFLAYLLTELS